MKLENIGFYTLEDERARNASVSSPLWRNELIITSRCNFKCPYCRGTDINGLQGDMSLVDIKRVIDIWAQEKIQNIRFSGGEPTIHPDFREIVRYTKEVCKDIKHIAVSTNGFSSMEYYRELISLGVNDFSISLDACCASVGDMMTGGVTGAWNLVTSNIREIAKLTYVTVGVVFDKQNVEQMVETIEFAHSLGVADIRIISAAQWNDFSIFENLKLDKAILDAHPILKYRVNNFKNKRNVRGIGETDARKCGLILDDMIVKGDYHYPCVIKMREGCEPLGKVDDTMRKVREKYYKEHNCFKDEICKKNCLDVCVDYNNKFMRYKANSTKLERLNSSYFTKELWNAGSIHDLGIQSRYDEIIKNNSKLILKKYAIGWCYGENLECRPKSNHIAIMFDVDGNVFWFHLRTNEFVEVFC